MKNSVLLIFIFAAGLFSCSIRKYIPSGEYLYVGNTVKVIPDSATKAVVASGLESNLGSIIKPAPNKTLFGFPHKVWWYYFIGQPKNEGGLRSWFREKLGEPPMFASQRVVDINAANLASFMENDGYYGSTAEGVLVKSKKLTATAAYTAHAMPRYFINEVNFVVSDSSVFSNDLMLSKSNSYLKKGDPVRLDIIVAERERIDRELKGKGYYYFNPEYLVVKADSTIGRADSTMGNQQTNLYLALKPQTIQAALKQYTINEVYVNTGTREGESNDTVVSQNLRLRRGIHVTDPGKRYKRRIFYDAIGFRRGSMYSNTMQEISINRLNNLQNFRFVRNRFDLVPRSDSALLNVYYDLAPDKKKSINASLSTSTKSNNLSGMTLDLRWKNRNLFKGGEILTIHPYVGFDLQLGGRNIYNKSHVANEYFRYGVEANLAFPRFIIPFVRLRPEKSQLLPKTILSVNFENRVLTDYYTTRSIRTDWSYVWSKNSRWEHAISPISLNFVEPRNVNLGKLDDIIFDPNTNPLDVERYLRVLDAKYFIAGSGYSFSYHPSTKPFSRNQFVLSGGFEYGGNLLSLLSKKNKTDGQPKTFVGVPIFQYGKIDGELRYYRTVTPGIKWANRFLIGAILPYGNSKNMQTPLFKQYFAGGSTGLRAFRARSLGPGSFRPDSISVAQLGYQSTGDIRLEFSSEVRLKFNEYVYGAVFMDAGNIWSVPDADRSSYDERALITSNFIKQVAVGGGLGLRLDFSYLIFRLDLATPFRKPWYTSEALPSDDPSAPAKYKNPWVLNEINFGSRAWRKENLVLNIAVGLPF